MLVHLEQRIGQRCSDIDERKRIVGITRVATHIANYGQSVLLFNHGRSQERRNLADQQNAIDNNIKVKKLRKRTT